ncbi:MAG: hypothetical protein KDA96_01800 [Planctomycetaceae bacterium]|nr:hypothetical protein [Planctomycetaceae bacterium]
MHLKRLFMALGIVLVLPWNACCLAQPGDDSDEDIAGLLARYGDSQTNTADVRIEAAPVLDWSQAWHGGPAGRASYRPAAGLVEWTGTILIRDDGPLRFHASLSGSVSIEIGGHPVLTTQSDGGFVSGNPVNIPLGDQEIKITFRPPDAGTGVDPIRHPARFVLFWSGPGFTLEPVPAEVFARPEPAPELSAMASGERMLDALRCAACHQPQDGTILSTLKPNSAPSLDRVADSWTRATLAERIRNPTTAVRDSRMPHFGLTADESLSIAAFLLDQSKEPRSDGPVEYQDADIAAGKLLLTTTGCVSCHDLQEAVIGRSDDKVVSELIDRFPYRGPELNTVGRRRNARWLDRWLRDPGSLNEHHRMPVFELTKDERRQIVAALSEAQGGSIVPSVTEQSRMPERTDAERIRDGRKLVTELGCAACHSIRNVTFDAGTLPSLAGLGKSAADRTSGCLSESASPGSATPARIRRGASGRAIPAFQLSQKERTLLQGVLQQLPAGSLSGGPSVSGSLLLHRNGCLQCHDRDTSLGLSSVAASLQAWLPELKGQSQGMIPPSLTAAGDKLFDEYLATAVAGEQKQRRLPWLSVRMPKFNHSQDERSALVQGIIRPDRIPEEADSVRQDILQFAGLDRQSPVSSAELLEGNQLTGAAGFNCVACHQAGAFEPRNVALGTRGSDIMTMGNRIRPIFFHRWMQNPIRVIRGIEMPALRKAVPGIQEGSLPRQIAVVWHAISDPRFTPPTMTSRYEQVVNVPPGSVPRIIRDVFTFGAGKEQQSVARAFAAGFSNGHSLLLDLDTMHLRQWTIGEFARQRTEGKSWFWDMAGTEVLRNTDTSEVFRLFRTSDGRLTTPVPDEGRIAELVNYRVEGGAIRLHMRLRFDTAEFESPRVDVPNDETAEPHFAKTAWQDPARPLEQVELLVDLSPVDAVDVGTAAHQGGWKLKATVADLPPGCALAITLPELTSSPKSLVNGRQYFEDTLVDEGGPGTAILTRSETASLSFVADVRQTIPPLPEIPPLASNPEAITVVPGFAGLRLPLPQSVMPTAIAVANDGRLAMTSLKGDVVFAVDSDGDGLHDRIEPVEEGLAAPFGIFLDGSDVVVAHKPEVLRLTDTDNDGRADLRSVVAAGWGYSDNYHDWTTALARDKDGNIFIGLGSDYSDRLRDRNRDRWRGGIIRVDPSGIITPVAMSMRYPMGLAFDRAGNLFATDNQGVQNTFNEINQILPGRHYGVPSKYQPADGISHETPGLMVPHPWVRSVNAIQFLPDDYPVASLRGHGIGCEYDNRMLIRFTIQEVNGTLQGATYPLSLPGQGAGGSNFVGPICLQIGEAGEIYIGSIWDSGWQGGTNTGAVERLVPSQTGMKNGIREIRAIANGFEISFFDRIEQTAAVRPDAWSLQGFTRVWSGSYATPDSDRHNLTPSQITVTEGGMAVRIEVRERLKAGYMYDITFRPDETAAADLHSEWWPVMGFYSMKEVP